MDSSLTLKRGVFKRKVTIGVKKAEDAARKGDLDELGLLCDDVRRNLEQVRSWDEKITNALIEGKTSESDLDREIDEQVAYSNEIDLKLVQLTKRNDDSAKNTSVMCRDIKLPQLKIETFTGEKVDYLKYHNFLTQFNNAIGHRANLSGASKLTYLRGYLSGYAAKLIEHLSINDGNYREALALLDREFLNRKALVNDLCQKLFALKCKYDATYGETKLFIGEVRSILADLKIYECEVLEENSANVIVSSLVFSKLPIHFKQELARRVNNNYPSLTEIFDNYIEVIATLNLRAPRADVPVDGVKTNAGSSTSTGLPQLSKQVFSNLATAAGERKACKFCFSLSHSMINCSAYPSFQSRQQRCAEPKLCERCSSAKHTKESCNATLNFECKHCRDKTHISALCSKANANSVNANVCLNSASDQQSGYILPTITLPVRRGNLVTRARFLIDTGSQRSYVSCDVLDRIQFPKNLKLCKYTVNTFLEKGVRNLSEVSLALNLLNGKPDIQVPILVDKDFRMSYRVNALSVAISNLKENFTLADTNYEAPSDSVTLDGILGIDVIQCMKGLHVENCMKGSMFRYGDAIIPFGNVEHFQTRRQAIEMYKSVHVSSNQLESCVNFVLDPVPCYPDPIASVLSESQVDGNLEKIFRVESIGISDNDNCSNSDKEKVEQFAANIQLQGGKYHVKLPWKDSVNQVKNNFPVALAVLNRVKERLRKKGLLGEYDSVLEQQLAEGIIEPVRIDTSPSSSQVFIPYREVVRTDPACTTKVRPVLNCSAKVGKAPSLNEASFPGVDLMGNLFQLLIGLRHDKYLVLADIRKAFLQIKL